MKHSELFFNDSYNISFKHPRSDVCDLYFKFEQKGFGNLSETEKLIFESHKNKIEA